MIGLITILTLILLAVIIVQIGKISELAGKIRGEEVVNAERNNRTAVYLMIFLVVFLVFCFASAWWYKDSMLGYGPHQAASAHGGSLDGLFNITLFFTGIVFVATHIALFWFSYKYREDKNRKSYFFVHSTKLEVFWTVIPSIVLIFLVVKGLVTWNEVMADIGDDEEHIEIEATGYQFAWDLRYPGPDGKLGTRDFKQIDPGSNPLGQVWEDPKNIDDFQPSEIVLPKGKKVRVRITSKDVLHNFYLPHFRVKMDAVPGLPTYFVFTPILTTEEYRQNLKESPEWQVPSDPAEPDGPQRWETFEYELACAELCGKGHYSMRRLVKIVEPAEYEKWLGEQDSYFMSNIRNTDADPYKGQLLDYEILTRETQLKDEFTSALGSADGTVINLKNVFFNSGSPVLQDKSKYELNNLAKLLNANPSVKVELSGHTDSQGDDNMNLSLSDKRALAAQNYLVKKGVSPLSLSAKGYGEVSPLETNDTAEGRQANRRTELKIISK